MTDNLIYKWKQRGHLYFWQYPDAYRNYTGWHFSADSEGVSSLLELIAAFQCGHLASYRTLQISQPTPSVLAVPNNGRAHTWSPSRLRLHFDDSDAAHGIWNLKVDQDTVVLELGKHYLAQFQKGILDIERGRGDYCIGGHEKEARRESTCLWFWWQPNAE